MRKPVWMEAEDATLSRAEVLHLPSAQLLQGGIHVDNVEKERLVCYCSAVV